MGGVLGRVGKAHSRQMRWNETPSVGKCFVRLKEDHCGQSIINNGSGKTEVGGAGLWGQVMNVEILP